MNPLSSRTKRTWLLVRSAVVNVVAPIQVSPSVVVWNVPWVTFDTVNVKLLLSGSLMLTMLLVNGVTIGEENKTKVKTLENAGKSGRV